MKMKVILVDSRYYGAHLCHARKLLRLRRRHAAEILGVTYQDYLALERGQRLIPEPVVQRLMHMAFVALMARSGGDIRRG